jgi:VanZ family protein
VPSFLPTGAERGWWLLAAAYTAAIYASAYYVRFASSHLRERGLLAATVAGLGAAGAAGFVVWWARGRPSLAVWALLPPAGLVYLETWRRLERFEERIHLLEYGLLGAVLYHAFVLHAQRAGPGRWRWPALGAFVLATTLGWLDEGIQHLLPNRYYDLRDVGLNALAAGMAILLVALRRRDAHSSAIQWPSTTRKEPR